VQVSWEFYCIEGAGKLLAAGLVTSCCPAYISEHQPVSPPLASEFLEGTDVRKEEEEE